MGMNTLRTHIDNNRAVFGTIAFLVMVLTWCYEPTTMWIGAALFLDVFLTITWPGDAADSDYRELALEPTPLLAARAIRSRLDDR